MVEILVVGIAIGFNFIILKYKYDKERYGDLFMDVTVMLVLSYLFGGTILGLAAAMVGGMLVSLYLLFVHKEHKDTDDEDDIPPTKPNSNHHLRW